MELRVEAFNYVPPDPAWQFVKNMDEYALFRPAVKSGSLQDSQTIIERVEVGPRSNPNPSDVPSDWLYETVYMRRPRHRV
jgi:hypothetical protein